MIGDDLARVTYCEEQYKCLESRVIKAVIISNSELPPKPIELVGVTSAVFVESVSSK